MLEERLSTYMALCAASEDVVVSYPLWSGQEENSPSEIMTQLQNHFPQKCGIEKRAGIARSDNARRPKRHFCRNLPCAGRNVPSWLPIYAKRAALLPECQEDVQAIVLSHRGVGSRIENKETGAAALLGPENFGHGRLKPTISVRSAIFAAMGCIFGSHCLRSSTALQYGNLAHYVLEHVLPQLAKDPGLEDSLQELVDTWMDTYAEETLGGLEEQTARFRALFKHYRVVIGEVARYAVEELKATDFVPDLV